MQLFTNLRLAAFERGIAAIGAFGRYRRKDSRPAHLVTGERGEEAAYFYLRRLGFVIVGQRWHDGPLPGDIDLIAWHENVLCFLEVKTRTNKDVATASSAVDLHKRKTLRKLARQYLRQLPGAQDLRADLRRDSTS